MQPIHFAAKHGHQKLVDHLITTYKADPLAKNDYDIQPIHFAAKNSHQKLVDHLVTFYKADPGKK
jgi:ankyrin repeat protein